MSDDAKRKKSSPPIEHQFLKGRSGNSRGRRKGAVSLKRLTRKVALKKHKVKINGETICDTLLNLVIIKLTQDAASGKPSMVKLKRELRSQLLSGDVEDKGGFLVVPRVLSAEEWSAQADRRNAIAENPETRVEHPDAERLKAVLADPTSELGRAKIRFENRWGKH